VAGQQFTYTFDDIGNRQTAASGGDASGGNLHVEDFGLRTLDFGPWTVDCGLWTRPPQLSYSQAPVD